MEYTLLGVMHSVDKWLDGGELKQNEVDRAATMREKTLQIVEGLQAEIERLIAESQMADGYADALEELAKAEAVKEFADNLKATFPTIDDLRCTDDDIYTLNLIDDLVKEFTEGSDNDGGS